MRKTFNLLFVCLIALYGRIGYQIIHNTDLPQCQPEGSLSDVAEEVIAIPLETNKHCSLKKIRMIKRDREDLFLVSDRPFQQFRQVSRTNNNTPVRNRTAGRIGRLCSRSRPRPPDRYRDRT